MNATILQPSDLLGPMIDLPAEVRRLHEVYAMAADDKRDARRFAAWVAGRPSRLELAYAGLGLAERPAA